MKKTLIFFIKKENSIEKNKLTSFKKKNVKNKSNKTISYKDIGLKFHKKITKM